MKNQPAEYSRKQRHSILRLPLQVQGGPPKQCLPVVGGRLQSYTSAQANPTPNLRLAVTSPLWGAHVGWGGCAVPQRIKMTFSQRQTGGLKPSLDHSDHSSPAELFLRGRPAYRASLRCKELYKTPEA